MARFPSPDVAAALSAAAQAQRVPLSLLFGVAFVESSFDPSKLGPVTASGERAAGLMQLMPATAKLYKVTDPFDATQSALAGARFLSALAKGLNWNVRAMLAAYNWGPVSYAKAIAAGKPVPQEVRRFVDKVLAAQLFYRQQAPRAAGQLVAALNAAITKLAEDNPLYTPATELAANWAPFYRVSGTLTDAQAIVLPAVHTWWKAYKTVYERAPLDLGATDPSFLEPRFWLTVGKKVDRGVEILEQGAAGLGAALFMVALLVFAANARRR